VLEGVHIAPGDGDFDDDRIGVEKFLHGSVTGLVVGRKGAGHTRH
jgi:hypothetical protein